MMQDLQQNVQPIPVRLWWLKRLAIALAGYVCLLVLLRVWWGYEAERRFRDQVESWRAAGQMVLPDEFDRQLDSVPPEQNAAVLYERAIEKTVTQSSSGINVRDFLDEPERNPLDGPDAIELIQLNEGAFSLARRAKEMPQVAWSWRIRDWLPWRGNLSFQERRLFAKLLCFKTMYDNYHHSDDDCIESLIDLISLGDATCRHPMLIDQLVGQAITKLAFEFISERGSTIEISGEEAHFRGPHHPARPEQIRRAITLLLDDEPARKAYIHASFGDRALTMGAVEANVLDEFAGASGAPNILQQSTLAFLFRPMLRLDFLRGAQSYTPFLEAVRAHNYPDSGGDSPSSIPDRSLLGSLTHLACDSLTGSINASVELHFRILARRRMAAIALAIRWFEVEHGSRPDRLEQLVPTYLERLPLDPFANDGSVIRYDGSPDRAILYSVGKDGFDSGGLVRDSEGDSPTYRRLDEVFYLMRQPD